MAIEKVVSDKKERLAEERRKRKEVPDVSLDDQLRLAEILNDSPRIASLAGTQWEVHALKAGTQYLIAQRVLEIQKSENGSFGDVLKHFAKSIPAVLDVVTLCLLNDKKKIYEDGNPSNGFSQLFKETRDTIEWECDYTQFGQLLIEILQMLDVSFFLESLGMLDIFRQMTTKKKRNRTETKQQK